MNVQFYWVPLELFIGIYGWGSVSICPDPRHWSFGFKTMWDNSKWLALGPLHIAWIGNEVGGE